MFAATRQSLVWFLLASVAFAAIWCCCTVKAASATAQAVDSAHACCDPAPAPDSSSSPAGVPCMPGSPDDCPVMRARAESVPSVLAAIPPVELDPVAFAVLPAFLFTTPDGSAVADSDRSADPPPPGPTLLSLHTSLVC